MSTNEVVIYCDGAARGNPGPAAAGFVTKLGRQTYSCGYYLGEATNNVAEYQAVVLALGWLNKNKKNVPPGSSCVLYSDSELVVKQINQEFKVKNKSLKVMREQVFNLAGQLPVKVYFRHLARSKNKTADRLVNEVLNQAGLLFRRGTGDHAS